MVTKNLQETYFGKKIDTSNVLNIDDAAKLSIGKRSVIITGVSGQFGSFMVDYLLENTEFEIFGGVRRLSVYNHANLSHIANSRFHLVNFDLTDGYSISRIVEKIQPEYFINFAANSFVASSWDFPRQTFLTNTIAVVDILEAVRLYCPKCRVYQASSSEMWGNVVYVPQDEKHPHRPRSPYGASKCASHFAVKVYRESYGIYAVAGIIFNSESERRGEEFVTRKITKNVARIYKSILDRKPFAPLELGNIYAKRDWSYVPDMVDGVWKILNQEEPKDYILSSNETHTVKEFVQLAFGYVFPPECLIWSGTGTDEKLMFGDKLLLRINPQFYRPAEVDLLHGDSSAARSELGWLPKVSFEELVKIMVNYDVCQTLDLTSPKNWVIFGL